MNPLTQNIIGRIRSKGPITFETFMEMALYDPDYGYYASENARIGRGGDFYTSSHLHPVFGAMIGRQVVEMWEVLGRPGDFTVVEMGAGEGYLCKDMLEFLQGYSADRNGVSQPYDDPEQEVRRAFCRTMQYVIVERNALQQQRQQEKLKTHLQLIRWVTDVRSVGGFIGCVCSNELLDAFPVHRVRMEHDLREIYVDYDGRGFREEVCPLSTDDIATYFSHAGIILQSGYTTEVNLRVRDWLAGIEAVLHKGFIMTIDYGYPAAEYYSEDRNRGTLMCFYRHQFNEDPYCNIGEQDMTAHVNFSSLKQWGEEMSIRTAGYCGQGTFLLAMGLDREIARLAETSKDYLFELSRIKKLFLPQGLGESHKVMIQYKGTDVPALKGFSIRNQMKLL